MTSFTPITIPHESVNDEEVIIVAISYQDGEKVPPGAVVLDYETSKAINSLESGAGGHIAYACETGQKVKVGQCVVALFPSWDLAQVKEWRESVALMHTPTSAVAVTKPMAYSGPEKSATGATVFSKRAKLAVTQLQVDTHNFSKLDFVTEQDVYRFVSGATAPPQRPPTPVVGRFATAKVERIVVICANQISAEVIDDVLHGNRHQTVIGYVADYQYHKDFNATYLDSDVFSFPERISREDYDGVVLAMGGSQRSMRFRRKVFEHYQQFDVPFTNLISATANISQHVSLGTGNIIEGHVYIGTHAKLGDNNFVSYSTTIGHHNQVGSHNLFAPGVCMAGLVTLGDDCILPTGVNFIDRVRVGNRVVLPVGYNVTTDLPDDTVVKLRST
jgi:hypothetical protein